MDAVILCGGQGTRIRPLLPEGTPKCMIDIGRTPFLDILLNALRNVWFAPIILATGYGHDVLHKHITIRHVTTYPSCPYPLFSRESQPLGTAGAVANAHRLVKSDPFFIFNGDTYCDVNYEEMLCYHKATNSVVTVACDDQFRHVGTFIASARFVDLIPKADGKVDMAEVFTLLGQRHEPVGWFYTDAPFCDIGSPEGISEFRNYWARLPKGGEGRMVGNHEDSV